MYICRDRACLSWCAYMRRTRTLQVQFCFAESGAKRRRLCLAPYVERRVAPALRSNFASIEAVGRTACLYDGYLTISASAGFNSGYLYSKPDCWVCFGNTCCPSKTTIAPSPSNISKTKSGTGSQEGRFITSPNV